jgi:hypothetical protein
LKIVINVLLYARFEHGRTVVQSLLAEGAEHFYIFLDYPRTDEIVQVQRKILAYLNTIDSARFTLIRHKRNLGLAKSVRFAMDYAFRENDGAVLLEDDCVLRPGGLRFYMDGLKNLKGNPRVRSLCGYLFPNCNFVFGPDDELLMLQRFCTWGWATWADRWQDYEVSLKRIVGRFEENRLSISSFAQDMAIICKHEDYLEGREDIWSVPWILNHYLTSSFAVYPRESVIENIGFDGSGQNCESTAAFGLAAQSSIIPFDNWSHIPYYLENEQTAKTYMDRHGLKTYPGFSV